MRRAGLIAVGVLGIVGVALLGRSSLLRNGEAIPGVGRGEMGHSDLTQLLTDLHTKADVNAIALCKDDGLATVAHQFLPPDRVYETAAFIVSLNSPADGGVALFAIDCTSRERATLLVKRFKSSRSAEEADAKDRGLRLCINSSGQFVFYGDEQSMKWLARYYLLR